MVTRPTDVEMKRISEQMQQLIKDRLKYITIEDLGSLVLYCRVKMQKKQDGEEQRATVLLKFEPNHPLAAAVVPMIFRTLEIEGAKKLVGSAPRGPLEREISRLLDGDK